MFCWFIFTSNDTTTLAFICEIIWLMFFWNAWIACELLACCFICMCSDIFGLPKAGLCRDGAYWKSSFWVVFYVPLLCILLAGPHYYFGMSTCHRWNQHIFLNIHNPALILPLTRSVYTKPAVIRLGPWVDCHIRQVVLWHWYIDGGGGA